MSINNLLNQSGQIEHRSGTSDRHGKDDFDAPATARMRFEQTNKTITTATREREPIDGIVFVLPSVTVETGDRVTYGGLQYRVMRCSPIVLGNGQIHHKELMVQLWSYPS